ETQLLLAAVDQLIEGPGFDAEALARGVADLWRENRIIGRDPQTHRAIERLIGGADRTESGGGEESLGNGPLSRAIAYGLWFHDRPDQLVEATLESTRITHRDPVPGACSVAVAAAVAYCVTHREIVLGEFLDAMETATRSIDDSVADQVAGLPHLIARPEPSVLHELTELGHDDTRIPEGISSDARSTLLVSLYYFLRAPSDFTSTLQGCLLAGGDVDSTACVAGALAGAFNGEVGLDRGLVDRLVESDQITRLGKSLYVTRANSRG
ncbi:MAG: ADP-ribosylglycohydrolase family protein, partial [Planctomycetota bacterium]